MKISIIIPVYNTEKYLERCIDSLINQTYKNIELIFVNDGSIDKSLEILNKFKKIDNRIIVINQKNSGANIARKNGVEIAKGEYIMFVDSDDWLDLDAVNVLVKYLNKTKYDAIKFNGILEPTKQLKNNYSENIKEKEIKKDEIYRLLISTKILNNLCFTIYNTKLLKQIESFDINISNCEDYLINLEYYTNIDKMLIINDILYHYQINENSTTKTFELSKIKKNIFELMYVYNRLYKYLDIWNINTYENKLITSINILDSIETALHNLLIYDINNNYLYEILDNELLQLIRSDIKYIDIENELKKKSLTYRLKHAIMIKGIYYKKYHLIILYKYLLRIKRVFR